MLSAIYISMCLAVGFLGSLWTRRGVSEWYPTLEKPPFNPPNWVFGPVWTTLYILIGIAGARVHHDPGCRTLFAIQLALNTLWSYLFFSQRRPDLALIDILALWAAIAACTYRFAQVDVTAARLFWPYWAWVSFATLLNFEIWRRNR